jgi:hypothetical protein
MRFADLSLWSLHPADLINVVIPNLFGNPYTINRSLYWGEAYHDGREGYLVSFFFGNAVVLLAAVSFVSQRKRLQRTFLGVALLGCALALGRFNPLNEWICALPGFSMGRYPAKYFLVTALALSVLSALGLEFLYLLPRQRRRLLLVASVPLLLLGVLFLGVSVYWQSNPQSALAWIVRDMDPQLYPKKDFSTIAVHLTQSVRWSGIFGLVAAAMLFLRLLRDAFPIAPLMTVIVAAELMPCGLGLSPLISQADVEYTPQINHHLQKLMALAPSRVVSLDPMDRLPIREFRAPNRSAAWFTLFYREAGMPMYGVMNGIQYSVYPSIDELNTRDSNDLLQAFRTLDRRAALRLLQKLNTPYLLTLGEIPDPQVKLMGVFETHSDLELKAWELQGVRPRAYFVASAKRADSHDAALQELTNPKFAFEETIVLEAPVTEQAAASGAGTVRVIDYRSDVVRCDVHAQRAGYLTLLDSYYPGWRAYVDGKPAPILRANYAFRAVEVPQGNHRVEFRYRPTSFYAGAAISSATLLTALCLTFRRRKGE